MHQKGWHEPRHDISTVLLVQELNDDHNIGSHEDLFILLPEQLLQELEAFLLVDDPVCTNTLDVDGEGQ